MRWRAIVILAILLMQSAATAAAGQHPRASSDYLGHPDLELFEGVDL